MRFNCPSCNKESITLWQKAWADRFLPGKCKECGARFFKALTPQIKYFLIALLVTIPVVIASIHYKQPYILLVNIPIFLGFCWLALLKAPLVLKK